MRSLIRGLFTSTMLAILLVHPAASRAQDGDTLSQTISTYDRQFSVDYPADWDGELVVENESLYIFLSSNAAALEELENEEGSVLVAVIPPTSSFPVLLGIDWEPSQRPRSPEAYLEALIETLDGDEAISPIKSTMLNDKRAAQAYINESGDEGLLIVVDLNDGDFALLIAFADKGSFPTWEDSVMAIAGSMRLERPEPLPALELTQHLESEKVGLQVAYPEAWFADINEDEAIIALGNTEDMELFDEIEFGTTQAIVGLVNNIQATSADDFVFGTELDEVVTNTYALITDMDYEHLEVAEPEAFTIGEYEALRLDFHDGEFGGMILAFDMGQEAGIVLMVATFRLNEKDTYMATFLAIAENLTPFVESVAN